VGERAELRHRNVTRAFAREAPIGFARTSTAGCGPASGRDLGQDGAVRELPDCRLTHLEVAVSPGDVDQVDLVREPTRRRPAHRFGAVAPCDLSEKRLVGELLHGGLARLPTPVLPCGSKEIPQDHRDHPGN